MDIVEKLRSLVEEWWECCEDIHEPLAEAANEIERLREALIDMSFYISGHNWVKLKPETRAIYDAFTQNEAQILATNKYEAEGRN